MRNIEKNIHVLVTGNPEEVHAPEELKDRIVQVIDPIFNTTEYSSFFVDCSINKDLGHLPSQQWALRDCMLRPLEFQIGDRVRLKEDNGAPDFLPDTAGIVIGYDKAGMDNPRPAWIRVQFLGWTGGHNGHGFGSSRGDASKDKYIIAAEDLLEVVGENPVHQPTLQPQPRSATLTPQANTVLRYMTREGSITPLKARHVFQIESLSARISELRKAGYGIKAEWRVAPNGKRYREYALKEKRMAA